MRLKERDTLTHEIERLERIAADIEFHLQKVRGTAQVLRGLLRVGNGVADVSRTASDVPREGHPL